jgi:hypothetical protein
MEVAGEKYKVNYDSSIATLTCEGMMNERGKEGYKSVSELFENVVNQEAEVITMDIRNLEFLNSSGITVIGGFVIKLRNKGKSKFVIHCTKKYTWQERSMKGIKKLMPDLELKIDGL